MTTLPKWTTRDECQYIEGLGTHCRRPVPLREMDIDLLRAERHVLLIGYVTAPRDVWGDIDAETVYNYVQRALDTLATWMPPADEPVEEIS